VARNPYIDSDEEECTDCHDPSDNPAPVTLCRRHRAGGKLITALEENAVVTYHEGAYLCWCGNCRPANVEKKTPEVVKSRLCMALRQVLNEINPEG